MGARGAAVGQRHQPVEPRQRLRVARRAPGRRAPAPMSAAPSAARRAIALQHLRDRALAENEVGQQDRGDLDEVFELLLDARDLVGADHRHAGKREFERDRAGRGERRARAARNAANFAASPTTMRGGSRPTRRQRAHLALDMRQGRQNDLERPDRLRAATSSAPPKSAISRRLSERREPGSTTMSGGVGGAAARLVRVRPQVRRAARSADGRHRRSAGRRAADAPPARTAAAPARNRHRRASPWRGRAARPRRSG